MQERRKWRKREFKYKRYNCDSLPRRDGRRMDQMKPSKFQHPLRVASLPVLPPQPPLLTPSQRSPVSLLVPLNPSGVTDTKASSVKHAVCRCRQWGGDDAKSARANGLALEQSERCTTAGSRLGVAPGAPSTLPPPPPPPTGVGESLKCAPGCNIIPLGG